MDLANEAFHRLQFKASHNSYDRDVEIPEQLEVHAGSPAEGACRGLELDIVRHSDGTGGQSRGYFQVNHVAGNTGPPLANYLALLLTHHHHSATHDPVFVTLDIKSEAGSHTVFPDEIDTYLREWFAPSLLFKPADLLLGPGDLVKNVAAHGWPTLGKLRGKFCFCLSGNEKWKSHYADTKPVQRLCFADFAVQDDDAAARPPQSGNRAIANYNLFNAQFPTWRKTVPRFRSANMLVRGYLLNKTTLWQRALAAGVNVLTTDKITGTDWAAVGPAPYRLG